MLKEKSGRQFEFQVQEMQNYSDQYYSQERPELLKLILSTGEIQSVLDLGCGFGYLGRALKAKGAKLVEGVELNPRVASEAMSNLDRVLLGSVENEGIVERLSKYDCIICGDILEHLVDPWLTLIRLKSHLKREGRIVASLPNIRYFKILYDLIFQGTWEYKPEGILDQGHLRFFTKKESVRMFWQAGYEISMIEYKYTKYFDTLNRLTFKVFNDFFAFQFLLVAKIATKNKEC